MNHDPIPEMEDLCRKLLAVIREKIKAHHKLVKAAHTTNHGAHLMYLAGVAFIEGHGIVAWSATILLCMAVTLPLLGEWEE